MSNKPHEQPDENSPPEKEVSKVHDSRVNGQVVSWERQGHEKAVSMLAVESISMSKHAGLTDGTEEETVTQTNRVAEMSENKALGVMIALADYFDYEVQPT